MYRDSQSTFLLGAALAVFSAPVAAKVTRVVVERTEPTRIGTEATGDYEVLIGRFFGEIDPRARGNSIITDLEKAPRNSRGNVEYDATFRLARPIDPAKRSGLLMYDVPNRGMIITGALRGGSSQEPGGHVWVASGWQGDLANGNGFQSVNVPIAHESDGRPTTGPVLIRLSKLSAVARSAPLTTGLGIKVKRPLPVSLDTSKAALWGEERSGRRTEVPAGEWAFADCRDKPFPGTPDPAQLCTKAPFDPDAAYSLTYEGRDPAVLGVGFAATRDLISFLRSGKPDDAGTPNPAGEHTRWTIGTGASQSGNYLRSFVHLGFNADEHGARAFDGINPQVAARQVPLNIRFGVPGGAASTYELGSEGTLWWGRYNDRVRGRGKSSLLDRCSSTGTCPKIMETFGSAEFWGLRASPGLVGTDARSDIALPDKFRRYYFPATAHGGSLGKGFVPQGDPRRPGCLLPGNPNPVDPTLRAVQNALVAWVVSGREPPASRYPTLAGGDLVRPTALAMGWPEIPGAPHPDGKLNEFVDYDFGPVLRYNDVSGVVTRQPPVLRRTMVSLVPRVNSDGNETSGIPSVHLQVPLGSYVGWNVENSGIDKGRNCGFEAGFIPFERTEAERIAKGDPRPSLEERYRDHDGFVARVRQVAAQEVVAGWLLPDDAAKIVADAERSKVLQ